MQGVVCWLVLLYGVGRGVLRCLLPVGIVVLLNWGDLQPLADSYARSEALIRHGTMPATPKRFSPLLSGSPQVSNTMHL